MIKLFIILSLLCSMQTNSFEYRADIPLEAELQKYIYDMTDNLNLDYEMVLAIIEVESGFDEKIVSKTGDYGLMQINKMNHGWLNKKFGGLDFLYSYDNVFAGIIMLDLLKKECGDDMHKLLTAYNKGLSTANKLWAKGVRKTDYSKKVMSKMPFRLKIDAKKIFNQDKVIDVLNSFVKAY